MSIKQNKPPNLPKPASFPHSRVEMEEIDMDAEAAELAKMISGIDAAINTGRLSCGQTLEEEDMEYILALIREQEEQLEMEQIIAARAATPKTPVPRTPDQPISTFGRVDASTFCVPYDIFKLLSKGKYHFQRQYGVKLLFTPSDKKDFATVEVVALDDDVVLVAMSVLEDIVENKRKFEGELEWLALQNTHIVVDNSNIFNAAKIVGIHPVTHEHIKDHAVRVNIQKLHEVVNNNRNCLRGFVAGSMSKEHLKNPAGVPWVSHFAALNYKVHPLSLGYDDKEWGVDSAIVADVAIYLNKFEKELKNGARSNAAEVNTLVMLTGDGNDNEGQASLFDAVEYALDKNWTVELWCWKFSVNKRYRQLAKQHQNTGKFKLLFLDNFRDEITFKPSKKA